jgi:hypothetical protein
MTTHLRNIKFSTSLIKLSFPPRIDTQKRIRPFFFTCWKYLRLKVAPDHQSTSFRSPFKRHSMSQTQSSSRMSGITTEISYIPLDGANLFTKTWIVISLVPLVF